MKRVFLALILALQSAPAWADGVSTPSAPPSIGSKGAAVSFPASTGGCSQASAAIALLPAGLSMATSIRYTTAICLLVSGGYWAKMNFFHIFATDNTPDAAIDLTGNGFNITTHGAVTFLPGAGYYGDGSTAYLTNGWTPSTNGGSLFTLNSASYGVGISNSRTTPDTGAAIGDGSASGTCDQLFPIFTGAVSSGGISTDASPANGTPTNAKGVWIMSRTGASAEALYQNGSLSGSTSSALTGTLSTLPVLIGAFYPSPPTSTHGCFSTDTIAFAFAASGMSSTDAANVSTIMAAFIPATAQNYYQAWGYGTARFSYVPSGLSDVDTTFTLAPTGYNWYPQAFWGAGNPSGSDFTYSGGILTAQASQNLLQYRDRLSTRGNTSSVFTGNISGSTLNVTAMLGVSPGANGGTAYNNPVVVGQLVDGAGIAGCSAQPTGCPTVLSQISGTTGGIGAYQLSASVGPISSETISGYSSVGQVPLFHGGGYFEFCASYNPALSPASSGFVGDYPTLQMVDVKSLWGQSFDNTASSNIMQGDEVDSLEVIPGTSAGAPTYNITNHDEIVASAGGVFNYTQNSNNQGTLASFGGITPTNQNCYGTLWITAAQNGGLGMIQRFVNGLHVNGLDITYSQTGLADPAWNSASGGIIANFAGNMYIGEIAGQFILQIDGGYGQPVNISSVTVRQ